jgi:uncharacterized iron-regulated membrane protein
LIRWHRWLSLAAMAFWLVQALTGLVCVFHWEIDDATISAPHRPTDLLAIDRRLTTLAPPGSGRSIASIWTSATASDRWDVDVEGLAGGASETVRIDGDGDVLRIHRDGDRIAHGGWLETIVLVHQTLLSGDTGSWIVGLSGTLLISNILMGLMLAWPRAGQWRRSLTPPSAGSRPARLYGWHRAVGLWAAFPALLLATTGVLSAFSDGFARVVAPAPAMPPVAHPDGRAIPFSRAVSIALARHPGATLSGVDFPLPADATWTIRLRAPGEPVLHYGNTTVWIDGRDGHVALDVAAQRAPAGRRLVNLIFPLHTGEAFGPPGRLAVMATGAWLASMIVIGALLWWNRRTLRRKPR